MKKNKNVKTTLRLTQLSVLVSFRLHKHRLYQNRRNRNHAQRDSRCSRCNCTRSLCRGNMRCCFWSAKLLAGRFGNKRFRRNAVSAQPDLHLHSLLCAEIAYRSVERTYLQSADESHERQQLRPLRRSKPRLSSSEHASVCRHIHSSVYENRYFQQSLQT